MNYNVFGGMLNLTHLQLCDWSVFYYKYGWADCGYTGKFGGLHSHEAQGHSSELQFMRLMYFGSYCGRACAYLITSLCVQQI